MDRSDQTRTSATVAHESGHGRLAQIGLAGAVAFCVGTLGTGVALRAGLWRTLAPLVLGGGPDAVVVTPLTVLALQAALAVAGGVALALVAAAGVARR